MKRTMVLTLFVGFVFLLQLSGCKEKQGITVKDVKQETPNMASLEGVVFDQSKVDSKISAGFLDVIEPQKTTLDAHIHIGGWAADFKKMTPAKAIIVMIDGKQTPVPITIGFLREDVAKAYKNNNLSKSGWDGGFNANIVGKGKHKLEIYAFTDNGKFVPLEYKENRFAEIEVTE